MWRGLQYTDVTVILYQHTGAPFTCPAPVRTPVCVETAGFTIGAPPQLLKPWHAGHRASPSCHKLNIGVANCPTSP